MVAKKNYRSLFGIRILKSIIDIFVDSFLVLYFMQVSNNNILPVGIYSLFKYSVIIIVMFLVKDLLKKKRRINILRLGISFNFIFFLLLLILKEKAAHYAMLLGIVYGVEEGLFYSIFNVYESTIDNSIFPKYFGNYTALKSIVSILVPIIFGSVMSYKGFDKCTIIVLVLAILKIILSFTYKDVTVPKTEKADLKKYRKEKLKINIVKKSHILSFAKGLTYSGAFSTLITVYIIRVFKTGFKLGVLTSIFAIITALASLVFANFIKRYQYKWILIVCNILTILSLILMIVNCNPITIILFNFIQSFSKEYIQLIEYTNTIFVSNLPIIKSRKEEYFLFHEAFIYIGRLISYITFCFLVLKNNYITYIVMILFVFYIIYRMYYSLKLLKLVNNYEK